MCSGRTDMELIWKNEVLFQDGIQVASIRKRFITILGKSIVDPACQKYEISTLLYMSVWDSIMFDTIEEVKRETERVIRDQQLLVNGVLYSAIEVWNGNIYFIQDKKD
jgi:hypothetical protein